ncbi:unnamed protein product [Kluyveromyces dobzhanskii CBS 2104]|uniref:Guanine-nucleotide exchange factor YEL1 n=1 Tax=Kluyveromyces dobzhanskii CBS 2104 TaxID=1427455 RepID=A0A0A8LA58_9SACH|nr:unnamed protein product [Kluyveromyces dobzhanskii CBS 2104]
MLMVSSEETDLPIVESPKMTNIHAFIDDMGLKTADQMIRQSYGPLEYTEYANWLGARENKKALTEFLNLLRPWPASLYLTMSKLSHFLYMIAEATPLDNILEELSVQWTEDHKNDGMFCQGDYRVCHIILFSLLILNSDLHNETFDMKFTEDQFVQNTINALKHDLKDAQIDEEPIKEELKIYYNQINNIPFPICQSKAPSDSNSKYSASAATNDTTSLKTSSNRRNSRHVSRKTSFFSLRPGSSVLERSPTTQSVMSSASEWSQHVNAADFYVHQPEDEIFGKQNDSLWLVDYTLNFKLNKLNSSNSNTPHSSNNGFMKLFRKGNSLIQEQQRAENSSKKMHRARVVVQKGSLELQLSKGKNFLSSRSFTNPSSLFGNSFVRKFNLFGAFAETIGETVIDSTGTSKSKWLQVQLSGDQYQKLLVLECSSSAQCQNYLNCINFWASRITPIPDSQFEMVSNQEYGWSEKLLSEYAKDPISFKVDPKIKIFQWEPLHGLDSVYTNFNVEESGKLSMDSQLYQWRIFVTKLADWMHEHNHLKPRLIEIWTGNPNFEVIMDNWNAKYLYLNNQYHKHNEYLKALEKGYEQFQ